MSHHKNLENFIDPRHRNTEELTEQNNEQAVSEFNSLVDDTLIEYADRVKTVKHSDFPNTSHLELWQFLDDGSKLRVDVDTKEAESDSQLSERTIKVQEFDGKKRFVGRHTYRFKPGSLEVTRSDDYTTAKNVEYVGQSGRGLEHIQPQPSRDDLAVAALQAEERKRAGEQLERGLGFNHLPVGPGEIKSLRELVETAGPHL